MGAQNFYGGAEKIKGKGFSQPSNALGSKINWCLLTCESAAIRNDGQFIGFRALNSTHLCKTLIHV